FPSLGGGQGVGIIPYRSHLKELARKNRNNPTASEKLLWQQLKGKKMLGYDFDRQRPIDTFIVDFYCKSLRLAIEIDGESHIGKEEIDLERQRIIESFEFSFLRFSDIDVKKNM